MADTKHSLFVIEIAAVLNRHGAENGSDTPDWILAQFITDALEAWNKAVLAREQWYGRAPEGTKEDR